MNRMTASALAFALLASLPAYAQTQTPAQTRNTEQNSAIAGGNPGSTGPAKTVRKMKPTVQQRAAHAAAQDSSRAGEAGAGGQ